MQFSVHPTTIYRALPGDQRRRRADRGKERCPVSPATLKKMFYLSAQEMSGTQVLELAVLNGWIEPGQISEPTYNRYLAKRQLSAHWRATYIKPHVRFEESYSNERHYLDITNFPDYFVEPDGSIGFESALQHSKNRKGNEQPRLHFFLLTDGHSRAKWASFYVGKNVLNRLDFLCRTWSPKQDPYSAPFQGRPHYLYSDMESIFRTPIMTRFLAAMDVHYHHHMPGESRSKGKVERPIGDMADKLTKLLRLKLPEVFTLSQANAMLVDYLYRENGRIHGTTRQKPVERWRAGFHAERPIRLMPEAAITQRFFYTMQERVIQGDLTLQLHGLKWQLPRQDPFLSWTGQSVPVYYHPGEEQGSIFVVIDDVEYEVTHSIPIVQAAGEYRALPVSEREKFLQELEQVDLSEMQIDGYKDRYAERGFLPTAGEALDVAALALPRRAISRPQLIRRLQSEGACSTPLSPEHKTYIDHLYADDQEVYEDQLDEILAGLTGTSGRQAVAL